MDIFDKIKNNVLHIDPVNFCESKLTLDGEDFRLNGNGYKPFADIYRYIAIKGIARDGKRLVFVKGRQVGATTMAAALESYFVACGLFGTAGRSPMRIMHCFPQLDIAYAYTKDKLDPMIATAIPDPDGATGKNGKPKSYLEARLDNSAPSNNSLQFKKFLNGNQIWVESTGLNGDRIRGRTIDCMFFDEVQDIRAKAIANSTKVLTQSKYGKSGRGIQVYFGTPKQRGSNFHNMWKKSTQQYYHLGCERCGEYFPLYTPGSDDWEDIWITGFIVRCTHCDKEQDKRQAAERGKWISMCEELEERPEEECDYIGFHINQLYIPTLEKELILAEKPENNVTNSETEYQNEVLGEFYSGDGLLLSPEDIDNYCADDERTHPPKGRKFRRNISIADNKRVYLGCDWGKKVDTSQMTVGEQDKSSKQGGQSYSCAVVLTVEGPERLSIDFATRLKKNDPDYKLNFIEQLFRQYSISTAVGDIGYAGDLTHMLQERHPNFLASDAKPHIKNKIKFVQDEFPKVIRFEKNYYIAELLDWLKRGRIRFPYGSFEQINWLIDHCCSMETKVTMSRTGDPVLNYVKGGSPNDGFMALLNAYIAYKYDLTKGFTIGHPSHFYPERMTKLDEAVPAISAYLPGMRSYGR